FFAGDQLMMLRRCLSLAVEPSRHADGVTMTVTVRADGVGHRVPTGFPDRNLVLAVEAFDDTGRPVPAVDGPALPPAAGRGGAALRQAAARLRRPVPRPVLARLPRADRHPAGPRPAGARRVPLPAACG